MNLLDDFLVRAGLAGARVALASGPLGSFVVWRRMVYFGDATAHAAILGVALSLLADAPVFAGTLIAALLMGLAVTRLTARGTLADTALGVLSHSALAVGLVAISFAPAIRVDLSAWLFGDALAVGRTNLLVIWAGAIAANALIVWRWPRLLIATLNPDLAAASGIDARREELVLILALAVTVAVALKAVGALLVAAMLIVPAASARGLARSPEAMAVTAIGLGLLSVLAGLQGSLLFDTPAGPSIVSAVAAIYVISLGLGPLLRAQRRP